jgi:murein DD-endopeptidase MepM/ murein hydrolase activator NlpD
LAEAQEMAESMVSSLQKGGSSSGGGSEAFFTQSAINFLASCIYFFAKLENGKYSDLPHILSFMNRSYQEIFDSLFKNEEIGSLLSPFKTAYDNKAFDQLEGQIGTLKIFLSRLATKESFWVFSGDEVELKITDRENPSILILASDPGTQDINSALYSAVLNRTLRLVNSKHNLPGGIIADEFPTIYIHKIDNVVATARSNRVAVLLGLQEIPQLRQFYKKEVADTISAIVGNILSGSARDKNTLEWLEKFFGKIKQKSFSQSISQQGTTTSINEKMDFMIPAGKIAALRTGEMVGMIAQGEENDTDEYKTSAINGKINLDMKAIKQEEQNYVPMPVYYSFIDKAGNNRKEEVLMTNFRKINNEIELIVNENIKTVLPTKPQKMENIKILEAPKEEGSNQKKDKKSWKNIFNSTTKSELKNKLDSLKTMLKNYNETNNERRSNSEKLKDSLFELIQKFQPKENDEKEMQKAPFGGLGACISLPLRNNISITSPYGVRTHPIFGTSKMHNGIDLKANYEDVHAVLDGIITETGWDSKGGGNYIKIKHFNRFETSYLHLSEIYYKVGRKSKGGIHHREKWKHWKFYRTASAFCGKGVWTKHQSLPFLKRPKQSKQFNRNLLCKLKTYLPKN